MTPPHAINPIRYLEALKRRSWFSFVCDRFALALLFLVLTAINSVAAATDIVVLQSHDSAPYQQALASFQANLAGNKLAPNYQVLSFTSESERQKWLQTLQLSPPKLILTLGTPATHAVIANIKKTPIVASLILDADELRAASNATGVSLNFPLQLQWQWFRRMLPDAQHVAVLYDPAQGAALFQAMQKMAQADGINLIPAPFQSPEQFPAVINNLPSQLDALWPMDSAGYNSAAVKELLLYSFRNRVPVVGLSSQWVKAGALYALDWDYADLGAQAADLAKEILLKNASPSSLPPLSPRKVRPVLNRQTAEHMKLSVPERLLQDMAEVY